MKGHDARVTSLRTAQHADPNNPHKRIAAHKADLARAKYVTRSSKRNPNPALDHMRNRKRWMDAAGM